MNRKIKSFLKSKEFFKAIIKIILFIILMIIGGSMLIPDVGWHVFWGVFIISWGVTLSLT